MPLGKVVVSAEEITQVAVDPTAVASPTPLQLGKLRSPIPWWAGIAISALILLPPILWLVTIILRVAFRSQTPRVKYAWVSFLSTLLLISGFLVAVSAIVIIFYAPVPAVVSTSLSQFDERSQFPLLPSPSSLSSSDISEELKPLVIVVSPSVRMWNRQEVASSAFGAGVLLHADKDGYLFATANHVADPAGTSRSAQPPPVMIATTAGIWATASVVATSRQQDLALVWIARHTGSAEFVQPIAPARDGENIFVIGHPEGLKFSLSTGIVSGLRDQVLQISAPVSPGNSGGPVYDDRGSLIGVVSSKFDGKADPNAENLGFAASTQALMQTSDWSFWRGGKLLLQDYIQAVGRKPAQVTDKK
jgi:S1-C subfamily serine protease